MNVFAIHLKPSCKKFSFVICLAAICALSSCREAMPPPSEYKFVGEIPIDDVGRGVLFVVDGSLYVLYGPPSHTLWKIKQYNLSNPLSPELEYSTHLDVPIFPGSRMAAGNEYMFFCYDNRLFWLNHNTFESDSMILTCDIFDLACTGDHLYLNSSTGLRKWNITNWPHYIEEYRNRMPHHFGRTAINNTILFEINKTYGSGSPSQYRFWNIGNASEPNIIAEGNYYFNYPANISMTETYVIVYESYCRILRFAHNSYDSLILEQSFGFGNECQGHALSDSIVYLLDPIHFYVATLDDFNNYVENVLWTGLPYNTKGLDLAIYDENVYILMQNKGIYIFEWRTP